MDENSQSSGAKINWRLLLLLALAVALACTFLKPASQKTKVLEISRKELTLQNGQLYRAGETNPFTGIMLDFYADGSRQSRSAVSNGLLHGLSEGWHTNGVLQVQENFREGISHGLRTKWHTNGVKVSEIMIVDGNLHGVFRRWSEDGTLAEEIEMKNGQPDGISKAYFPSGAVKAEARLANGEVIEQKFWQDGKLQVKASRPTQRPESAE